MDWSKAQDTIISFVTAGGIYFIAKELHSVRTSLDDIGKGLATLMERSTQQRKDLDRHEGELRELRAVRSQFLAPRGLVKSPKDPDTED